MKIVFILCMHWCLSNWQICELINAKIKIEPVELCSNVLWWCQWWEHWFKNSDCIINNVDDGICPMRELILKSLARGCSTQNGQFLSCFFSHFFCCLLVFGINPTHSPPKKWRDHPLSPILAPKKTAQNWGQSPVSPPVLHRKQHLEHPVTVCWSTKNNCFEQCCATACQHQVSVTMLHVFLPSHCVFCLLWLPTVGPCPSWGPHATATTATVAKSAAIKQQKRPLLMSLSSKPNLLCCHFANNPQNARIICIFGSNDWHWHGVSTGLMSMSFHHPKINFSLTNNEEQRKQNHGIHFTPFYLILQKNWFNCHHLQL